MGGSGTESPRTLARRRRRTRRAVRAVLMGSVAGLFMAFAWAAFVALTEKNSGIIAVVVGLVIGFVMARFRGRAALLPALSAAIGVGSCALGSVFAVLTLLTVHAHVEPGMLITALTTDPRYLKRLIAGLVISPLPIFWAIAGLATFIQVQISVNRLNAADRQPVFSAS